MPRALLTAVARGLATALLASACAVVLTVASPEARAATAQVSLDVPKGKLKTVRLRRLPVGTLIAVVLEISGKLRVALVGAAQLKSPHPRALFSAAFERRISFKVAIPQAGDYYLVLDNRQGADDVSASATVQAERAPQKAPARPSGKPDQSVSAGASPYAFFAAPLPSRSRPIRS